MAILSYNLNNGFLSQTDVTTVDGYYDALEQLLSLDTGLSNDDRQRLPKLHRDNLLFVQNAIEAVQDKPELLPGFITQPEFETNFAYYNQIRDIETKHFEIAERLRDTRIAIGAKCYDVGRAVYSIGKQAADMGVPGVKFHVDRMGERFTAQGNYPTGTPAENPADVEPTATGSGEPSSQV